MLELIVLQLIYNYNNDLVSTKSTVNSHTTKISNNTSNIGTLNTKVEELIKCTILRGESGVQTTVPTSNVWTLIKMTNSNDAECYTSDFLSLLTTGMFQLNPGYYYISASIYSKYTSSYSGQNYITIALRGSDSTEYNINVCSYYTTNTTKNNAGPQLNGKIIYLSDYTTMGLYARSDNVELTVSNSNAATWVSIIKLHD